MGRSLLASRRPLSVECSLPSRRHPDWPGSAPAAAPTSWATQLECVSCLRRWSVAQLFPLLRTRVLPGQETSDLPLIIFLNMGQIDLNK